MHANLQTTFSESLRLTAYLEGTYGLVWGRPLTYFFAIESIQTSSQRADE
jgi:hypothetical protein